MKAELTADRLRHMLSYDEQTGEFLWANPVSKKVKSGALAGAVNSQGYVLIQIAGVKHKAHRLAWLYVHSAWPSACIDHINRDKTDNRICNLREATKSENAQNKSIQSNNTSGMPGVYFKPDRRKWIARIKLRGHRSYLGAFETQQEAASAYLAARAAIHPFATKEPA